MKKYTVFVDIPQDGEDWLDIEVESMDIEAESPEDAKEKAIEIYSKSYSEFYVWDVDEHDTI